MNAQATAAAAALHHKPRAKRSAAPVLQPLDKLDRTHRKMVEVLVTLTALVNHLDEHGVDEAARQSAKAICKFFSDNARQHHADEETLVFPALIRQGDPLLIQHVLRLQQDHGWLEEDWLELAPQLQAVAQGYSWYELDSLRHAVGVFVALYHEHIALEESLVYPQARARMVEETAGQAQRMAGTPGHAVPVD